MKLEFSKNKVTLVVCPVDMRSGFERLSQIARTGLGIEVKDGKDIVVFISKDRKLCKMIHADLRGTTMIVRRLSDRCFQRIMVEASGPAQKPLSSKQLERYLDGEDIFVERENIFKN